MNKIKIIFYIIVLLLITGCAFSTENRIRKIESQYPQWDKSTVESVAKRPVTAGMTEEMVLMAMGKPWSITDEGGAKVWAYGAMETCGAWGNPCEKLYYFLYFRDKIVVDTRGDKRKLGFQYL